MSIRRNNGFFFLITTTLIFISLISAHYLNKRHQLINANITQTANDALHQLTYSEYEYDGARTQLASIVELLSQGLNLYEYVLNPTEPNQHLVERGWASVARNQKWYTQIRFINTQGKEAIQLDYSRADGSVESNHHYQDISDRAFFKYAETLKEGEVGHWSIDLEMENGQYTIPYRPALRIISPVTTKGKRYGYLVLNVDVEYLVSRLNFAATDEFAPEFINENGFYLLSSVSNKIFGHLLEERKAFNFKSLYPDAWLVMESKKNGFVLDQGNLFVFNKVSIAPNQYIYMVVHIDPESLYQRSQASVNDLFLEGLFFILLVLTFTIPITVAMFYYRKRSSESQLARAALSGMSAVLISDREHLAIKINDEFTKLTGLNFEQVEFKDAIRNLLGSAHDDIYQQMLKIVMEQGVWEGEISFTPLEKTEQVTAIMRVQSVCTHASKVSYYISSIVDITERKALEHQLRRLSEKDALTNLWNRRKFEAELSNSAKQVERYPNAIHGCLALLDIDHFKRVNDELGHDEGDRVISVVGKSLLLLLRETDFIARIGGEEFAILMPHTPLSEAKLALNRLREGIELDDNIPITVSIGLTKLSADTKHCYKVADNALYQSKSQGRNRISVWDEEQ
ncbi:sensor domain-containing diguanylate cyclase [Vibrio sinensis]|uniref:sensor domain-containing diguanylate cyclase n=1 Tax=Vibrio sinensis TaxID=2302434 RepID=UPI001FB4429D|nr:GGDEF domain-containing protein [Vibrio sinensis]